ncbi:hypothetical protein PG997_002370 [Apiospora hydei]|uniref:BZIP domain-containing protein n=1 Tax=Apiospora hydei TaxID=1337664 RepID=A0ABR1X9B2_9PEZI
MPKADLRPAGVAKCGRPPNSAYLELMKEDEDWRQLENAAERRKIQNRLAQRAYRRNLRNRNKEVETLREQLMRFQEGNGHSKSILQSSRKRSSSSSSGKGNSKGSSRSSPEACFSGPETHPTSCRQQPPTSGCGGGDPQFFDTYPDLDSDDSISFASGSPPGDHHSIQSAATDFGVQIMYDDHAKLSPLPPAFNTIHVYERGCGRPGEDPYLPADLFRHGIDYESSSANQHHLAPLPQKPLPRYASPIEFSRPVALGSDEGENSFCFRYDNTSTAEPGVSLTSIPPSITDFPAAAPGTHIHTHANERPRNCTMNSSDDAVNIHPALYNASSRARETPGSQQPAWPGMNDCAVLSLLHIAVSGGYGETVQLILGHWPELAHAVDVEGYTAAQRAMMAGRDDIISIFTH